MKLQNKKTGEIGCLIVGKGSAHYIITDNDWASCGEYNSLAELNEEWQDYEEPNNYWYLQSSGEIVFRGDRLYKFNEKDEDRKLIGNYFETKEEAEKAVKKLKAWKRLEEKGFEWAERFSFGSLCGNGFYIDMSGFMPPEFYGDKETLNDLDLLFGGEK